MQAWRGPKITEEFNSGSKGNHARPASFEKPCWETAVEEFVSQFSQQWNWMQTRSLWQTSFMLYFFLVITNSAWHLLLPLFGYFQTKQIRTGIEKSAIIHTYILSATSYKLLGNCKTLISALPIILNVILRMWS